MDLLDLVIAGAVLLAALSGYRRGITLSVLSWAGLIGGLAAGAWVVTQLPSLLPTLNAGQRAAAAVVGLLALGMIGNALGAALGYRLRVTALRSRLGAVDSLLGTGFAVVVALTVSWFLGLTFSSVPVRPIAAQIQRSTILRVLDQRFPRPPGLFAGLEQLLAAVPFPQVFANLAPTLPGPVTLPSNLAHDPGVVRAAQETVKVVSPACGAVDEGSGFPVGPDLIVTNAHVVAGGHDFYVQIPGRGNLAARLVRFDPRRDLALLWVPGLNLRPLPLGGPASRGTMGAVIGYPGGGPEQVIPAGVRGSLQAVGRDIYASQVVSRSIFVLQANVEPGNSGGPLVNLRGQVLGVVFAKSSVTTNLGFALTTAEMLPDLAGDAGLSARVGSGACLSG
ncbi:MAG TPA: MarP family serine protease [Candidatus Dormibacteraeota bacterium]|nr:MarP family serine protease [Candidatus Dormibacteraeota bacterium]